MRHGFTEVRLRAWVRDDLRTQAYLAQRFASASTPTDAEIAAAYAQSQRRVRPGRRDLRTGRADRSAIV